ncbi:factor of DNA methylation 1-like isoform X3 [Punica granatum]|uniref:Factor of DNA methylation 1-like isoform X3 n=1 Tax=Punica granatum TaxID=22663 RepID=A0A6P8E1Q0_PUNGR|nr:factor of DNA methylation 1-like isoform X3 [Punica granatum]
MKPWRSPYAWCAHPHDYEAEGPVGDYLWKMGKLRSIRDIVQESDQRQSNVVSNLTDEIDMTNKTLDNMQYKFNESSVSLKRVLEEKDRIVNDISGEEMKLQPWPEIRSNSYWKSRRKCNMSWRRRGEKLNPGVETLINVKLERERQKLDDDKKKNEVRNISLELASTEQQRSDENVRRLVEKQKNEKEVALRKLLDMERQLNDKQKLEMEIQELKGRLEVMKHLTDRDNEVIRVKMKEISDELEEKVENLSCREEENEALLRRGIESRNQLQETHRFLISAMQGLLGAGMNIGMKRLGELDRKPFQDACRQRFSSEEAETRAAALISLWESQLGDPSWHPMKVVDIKGKAVV